jgi:hypothetical protein
MIKSVIFFHFSSCNCQNRAIVWLPIVKCAFRRHLIIASSSLAQWQRAPAGGVTVEAAWSAGWIAAPLNRKPLLRGFADIV